MRKIVVNHRRDFGWLTALLVIVAVVITASGGNNAGPPTLIAQAVPADEIAAARADIATAQAALDSADSHLQTLISTTTTRPSTTTTTRPGSTTTTRPTTTTSAPTTTQPPTTTSTTPPTTTTTDAPCVPTGERYDIWGFQPSSGLGPWWVAPYFRTLCETPETGWLDGDRSGYRCAYGFLEWEGTIVGRFTFTRFGAASGYAGVNDKFMLEGQRYYDGRVAPIGAPRELGECPPPSEPYVATAIDERATIDFLGPQGQLLERRKYTHLSVEAGNLSPDVTFEQVASSEHGVAILAKFQGDPAIVVYYDAMVDYVTVVSDLDD